MPLSTISDILIGTPGKKRDTQTFGFLNHLFGVAGNYPVHFRKVVDQSSPFFMQGMNIEMCPKKNFYLVYSSWLSLILFF